MQIFYFKVSLLFFKIRKIPLQCAKKEAYDIYGKISETVLPNFTKKLVIVWNKKGLMTRKLSDKRTS